LPIAHFIALCGLLFAGVTAALVQVQRYDQARCATLDEQRQELNRRTAEAADPQTARDPQLLVNLRPSWWSERWRVRC
jgi:hypothetical protein